MGHASRTMTTAAGIPHAAAPRMSDSGDIGLGKKEHERYGWPGSILSESVVCTRCISTLLRRQTFRVVQ